MENHSVLIADHTPLFAMNMEDLLRSNGFGNLRVETLKNENDLMADVAKIKPDVLMLGDLNTSESSARSEYYVPVVPELLASYPDLLIIDLKGELTSSDQPRSDRVVKMTKPLDDDQLMSAVSNWFNGRLPSASVFD